MKPIGVINFLVRSINHPLLYKEHPFRIPYSVAKFSSSTSNSNVYRSSNIFCIKRKTSLTSTSTRWLSNATDKDTKSDELEKQQISPPATDIGGGSWQEIYQGLLSTQVKLVKSFSLGTTIIGLSIQPVIINYLGSSMSLVVSFSALIGMFTFVTPALIHWFTKKYVFKLSYDPKTDLYAATTLSFFLREKTIHFRPSDVTIPEIPRMFTTFVVNKKPLFVDMDTFQDIDHYGRIMGYDKPLNLRVNPQEQEQHK